MHDLCAHNELLNQFHMKTQYMIITLSCFMYKLKFKRYCLEVNFDNFFDIKKVPFVNLVWVVIVGTTRIINSSNSTRMKSVKLLNNASVTCIVTNISWTLLNQIHRLTNILLHLTFIEQVSRISCNICMSKEHINLIIHVIKHPTTIRKRN
jgi:hypothetical protein